MRSWTRIYTHLCFLPIIFHCFVKLFCNIRFIQTAEIYWVPCLCVEVSVPFLVKWQKQYLTFKIESSENDVSKTSELLFSVCWEAVQGDKLIIGLEFESVPDHLLTVLYRQGTWILWASGSSFVNTGKNILVSLIFKGEASHVPIRVPRRQ